MGIIVRMRLHFNINTNDFYIFFNFSNEMVESKVYEKLDEWQISELDERCDIIHVVLKLNILNFSKPNDYKGNKKTPKKGAMRVSSPGALLGEMINCLLDGTYVISQWAWATDQA